MSMNILVPVNASKTSDRTLAAIAANHQRFPAPLTLLHVVDLDRLAYRMIPDFQLSMIREHARKSGEHLLLQTTELLAAAQLEIIPRLEIGSPRELIPRIANDEHYQLLIIGRRGFGEIRDVLFGSVTNHVLHHVRCPVLLF
jgi:nucleotide-binding universal stress UspA family protein